MCPHFLLSENQMNKNWRNYKMEEEESEELKIENFVHLNSIIRPLFVYFRPFSPSNNNNSFNFNNIN